MVDLDDVSRALFARLSEREDDEIGALNEAYRAALEQTITRATGELPRDADGRLVPDAGALARLRRTFERFGDAEGASLLLEQHVERVALALDRQVELLSDGWQRLGEHPLEADALALSTLVRASWIEQVEELGRYHHKQLKDAVMRQALGRATPQALRAEMRRLSARSISEVDRLHHDALIGYSRAVIDESAAQRGYRHFQYIGPNDAANRPFCDRLVGEVLTREEIDALDNGQIPNVFLTGGGYRCRHHWRPVKAEWFDANGMHVPKQETNPSVRVSVLDMQTDWDVEHPLDYDELASLSAEEATTQVRGWMLNLAELWAGPRGTPRTKKMADALFSGEIIVVPCLTRAQFEREAARFYAPDELEHLQGFQHRDAVYFPIEGNSAFLAVVTHEASHVLDWLEWDELGDHEFEPGVTEREMLIEFERRAWLAAEEFRMSQGEPSLWPHPSGFGVDEEALLEWLREVY